MTGNRVAGMMAPLPVYEEDPVERLRIISEELDGLKDSGQAVGAQVLTQLSGFAPPTVLAQAGRLQSRQRFFNLVVTNVPGPQIPLYVLGRELLDVFPLAPLAKRQAVCIAIMSYNGKLNFGLLGDFDAMPDLEVIARASTPRSTSCVRRRPAQAARPPPRAPQTPAASRSNGSTDNGSSAQAPAFELRRLGLGRPAAPEMLPMGLPREEEPMLRAVMDVKTRIGEAGQLLFPAVQENRIELDRSGSGVAVLSVQGEHDVYTAPSLTEQVEGLIDERVPFVIDLTPATFVDSSVLRVLLEARRRAEEEGVGFAVALDQDDSGAVRRVLEVTGLIPVLPVHPARDAAMEAASTTPREE